MVASAYTSFRLDLYQLSGYLNSFILCHFHIHVHYLIATKLEEGVVKIVVYRDNQHIHIVHPYACLMSTTLAVLVNRSI